MNKIISSLFIILSAALAQSSCQYTKLSSKTIEGSAVIKDLRELGAEFVITQAIFNAPKHPVENEAPYSVAKTYSVERRISKGVYSFRYNVLITPGESDGQDDDSDLDPRHTTIINATYTISFRPSNGKVSVTSYRYSVRFPDVTPETSSGGMGYGDPKQENGPSDDAIDYVVEHGIKDGSLRDGKYSLGKVYSIVFAEDTYYDKYLVTLVRTDGYTVRAQITVSSPGGGGDPIDNYDYVIYTNRL